MIAVAAPLILALLTTFAAAQDRPSCASQNRCADMMKPGTATYKKYPDGTALPSPALLKKLDDGPPDRATTKLLDQLAASEKASPTQIIAARALMEAMKQTVQEEINAIEDPVAKAALTARFAKIHFNFGKQKDNCLSLDPQVMFDAGPPARVDICTNILNYPIEALIPAFAHEFAHALDTCSIPVMKIDPLKMNKKTLAACGVDPGTADVVIQALQNKSEIQVGLPMSTIAYDCGIAKAPAPLESKHFPFHEIHECFARPSDPSMATRLAQAAKDEETSLNFSHAKLSHLKPIPNPLGPKDSCMHPEAFADVMGGRLTARYLQDLKQKSISLNGTKKADMMFVYDFDKCIGQTLEGYLPPDDRINEFLVHPEIASAVGCDLGTAKVLCDKQALPGSSTNAGRGRR